MKSLPRYGCEQLKYACPSALDGGIKLIEAKTTYGRKFQRKLTVATFRETIIAALKRFDSDNTNSIVDEHLFKSESKAPAAKISATHAVNL